VTTHHTDGLLYCCQPSYGNGNKNSHRQFWARSVDPGGPYADFASVYDDHGSSLLADSFNYHWKTALNMQLAGRNVTRFIMLHDDVVPQDHWVDVLLGELDRMGADVVSSVIPIKDARGLTSTALDDTEDPWAVYRRLTLKELEELPETFDAHDCWKAGLSDNHWHPDHSTRPLLVNTGCWAADFTRPWRWGCHFEITNRIVFQDESGGVVPAIDYRPGMRGSFVNQVMSEDWGWGRQLARLGCRVLATRKVRLVHMGEAPYNNQDLGWGTWEHDESLAHKWLPDPYAKVPGWLLPIEGRLLGELAAGKVVLEIGSYCGKSTLWMARRARKVHCVDTWDGRGTPDRRPTLGLFNGFMREYGLADKILTYTCDTLGALPYDVSLPPPGSCDMAFIDGAHDRSSVECDITVASSCLKTGGVLAFHDYHSAAHPDVTKVVDELLHNGYEPVGSAGSVIVLRRKAPARAGSETRISRDNGDKEDGRQGTEPGGGEPRAVATTGGTAGDSPAPAGANDPWGYF
jgi:hypothetical protein